MEATSNFISIFQDLEDPRMKGKTQHNLLDILVIALCGVLSGADSWELIVDVGKARYSWFKSFLQLPNGIPSHDTFRRVFSLLDPEQFSDCFIRWTEAILPALSGDIVAIDGKALRAASQRSGSPLNMVTAFAVGNGIALGQMKSKGKKNEIKTIPLLLDKLMLEGCIVTLDAMGCQRDIAKKINQQRADYVIALKGNQGSLHDDVKTYLDGIIDHKALKVEHDYFETTDKGHGRLEVRRYYITEQIDWLPNKEKWLGLKSVGCVESKRITHDHESIERRYYITSLPASAKPFGHAVREHWGIENSMHWILDVIFNEDRILQSLGNAAENMALLRRLAINLLKRNPRKKTLKSKKLLAGMDTTFLEEVLFS